jgi:DUF971 family protein
MRRGNWMTETPWPIDISYSKSERTLHVRFDSGEHFALSAELLRVESPSAEVRGHGGAATKQLVRDKGTVEIIRMEPVGSYAVRLIFSDGHDSGLYSWATLHEYGLKQKQMLQAYRAATEQAG